MINSLTYGRLDMARRRCLRDRCPTNCHWHILSRLESNRSKWETATQENMEASFWDYVVWYDTAWYRIIGHCLQESRLSVEVRDRAELLLDTNHLRQSHKATSSNPQSGNRCDSVEWSFLVWRHTMATRIMKTVFFLL